jgi:hypothetical protein
MALVPSLSCSANKFLSTGMWLKFLCAWFPHGPWFGDGKVAGALVFMHRDTWLEFEGSPTNIAFRLRIHLNLRRSSWHWWPTRQRHMHGERVTLCEDDRQTHTSMLACVKDPYLGVVLGLVQVAQPSAYSQGRWTTLWLLGRVAK